ncbi:hypothetical protein JG688_00016924 [Phytophthora aleatoria]|uniref:Uncharacterized protein n=1 Tax=Phytophthora aleatoria TaxID=2496075 RepID=A0A8J5IBE3_9STRA|nr:hypothetical protein JG688_00016924 [Phytophthora aleatoria]
MELMSTKRNETVAFLENHPLRTRYRGALFEAAVHEKLSCECTVDARRLDF